MHKYDPLEKFLINMHPAISEFTLTFEQIEIILGDKLPPSAFKHRAWWSNEIDGILVAVHSWMNAKWMVDTVDQKAHWVRFRRQ